MGGGVAFKRRSAGQVCRAWLLASLLGAVVAAPAVAAEPDPGRTLASPTAWHWYRDRSAPQLAQALAAHGDRLIDLDVTKGNRYTAVMVRNAGPFQRDAGGHWFRGKTRNQVVSLTKGAGKRLIDLEPYLSGGKLRFAGVSVPNSGQSAKSWWWNYDLKPSQVSKDIDKHGIRLIDLEAYKRGGKTRYAYVGIKNAGVDASPWWWYYGVSSKKLGKKLAKHGARLIDLERLPNGKLAGVMIKNDGTYWGWWTNVSQTRMEQLFSMHGERIVDVEQYKKGGKRRFALVAIDNVAGETARIRGLIDDVFESPPVFGNGVAVGAYTQQLGGAPVVGLAEQVRFQPYSVLKLLPYAVAIDHVDRGAAPPGGGGATTLQSQIGWTQATADDPDTKLDEPIDEGCLKPGSSGTEAASASLKNALQTMMWESHNRTLDAVMEHFDKKPKKSKNFLWEGITSYVQGLGLSRTKMHQGCPGSGNKAPWLANRSTLADLATLYEQVHTGNAYGKASSAQSFRDLMINIVASPGYAPDYGGTNVSPITGRTANSPYSLGGWLKNLVRDVAGAENITVADAFFKLIRYRGKGGSANVALKNGKWESGFADQLWIELPINDGAGYHHYALGWWVNGIGARDDRCKNDAKSDVCKSRWQEERADLEVLKRELWREPVRRALQTWSPPENLGPTPTITSPADGSAYDRNDLIPLRATASDPEGDPLTYSWKATIGGTTKTIATTRNFDWKPADTHPGSPGGNAAVLTFTASDGTSSPSDQVSITVFWPPA